MKKWVGLCLMIGFLFSAANASSSISALEQEREVVIIVEDEAEAQLLAGEKLCTSRAQMEQYDGSEADVIQLAEKTFEETGTNGHTIVESIPSVEKIFSGFQKRTSEDLTRLKQLTYMQDFKYMSTGIRVVAGAGSSKIYEVTIDGGECIRSAAIEDFVILQLDSKVGEVISLSMEEYDADTGVYKVLLPSLGPYMVALKT